MDVQQGKQVNVVFRVAVKTNVRAVYVVGDDPQLGLGEENGTPKWDTRKGVHLRKRLIEKVGENSIWVGDPISVQSGGCLNYKYIVQCDDGVFWEKREDDRHIELPVGETQKEIDCDEVDYCRGPKIEENFPSPNTSATATTASRITNEVKQEPDPEEDFEHVGDEDGDNIRLEEKFQSMLDSQEKKLQEGFEAKLETLEWKAKQESDQYAAKVNELLKTVAKYGSVEALMRQAIAKQIEERTQEQAAAAAQLQTVLHEEVRKANEETLPAKLDKLKGELLSTSEENSQQKLKELEARLTKSFNNQLNVLKDDLESQRHDFTSLRQMTESFGKRFEAFKSEQKSEVTAQLDSKLQASETKLEEKLNQVTSSMSTTVDNAKVEVEGNFQNEVTRLQVELNKLRTETLAAQDGLEKQIEAKLVERLETAFEKESNHWTADLDSIKVLVQKETQGLMELKGNAEAQITEMKSRLCEFSTESQELNDALKKLEKQLDDERKKRRSDMKELATKKEVAELRESLQAEVQDERTRVEHVTDEFEAIMDRVNKVDKLEEACNALKQDVQRLSAELSKATSKMDYQASASQEAGLASNSRPEAQSASAAAAARTPVSEPNDEAAVAQPEQQSEQSGPTRTPSPSPRQTPTPIQSARSAPAAAAATAQQPQQPPRAPAHGGGTRDDARDAAAPVLLQASVSPFDIPPLHEWEVSAAYARAQEILENLKIFRRKIVDHEDRRRQLKSVHLQVHPDKGDTPEEKELRVILWAWWQTWMENNGEWYVVGTPGAKMQSEEAIEL
eukprot:CAMPEP_0206540308 /NCGR_PEP_ID=MMETSP0325_2-20121206/8913_1 /ASSEMBLY_ACC=CAM_ASM_000347 /TAXON_ID=2866 /ORGANISM="Crypthecodinium cohnii, Strain Seligo" /LENGTH=790 /DNA_ID=CAMNT_0054037977 /DNA_START=149 /DNA_END=2521 /DNA_ORIENTATION=-